VAHGADDALLNQKTGPAHQMPPSVAFDVAGNAVRQVKPSAMPSV